MLPVAALTRALHSRCFGFVLELCLKPTFFLTNYKTTPLIMHTHLHSLCLGLLLATTTQSLTAANVTLGDPVPNTYDPVTFDPVEGGLPYRWQVAMAGTDSGTATRHVGAWSWEDNALFNAAAGDPPVGWTHTSDWVLLTLNTASAFTLRLERQAGVAAPSGADPANIAGIDSMFPSFTIYSGVDHTGPDSHTYNNKGNVSWADGISYLDHVNNSTLPAVERSWNLPAGVYSIVLGSNAPATDTNRQGYLATFTTTPVPEPSSFALLSLIAGLATRRKRA